jgi:hypothetical protein
VSVAGHVRAFRSLAFAATVRHDPPTAREVRGLLEMHRHPYAAFVPTTEFPVSTAAQVYCLDPKEPFAGIDCNRFRGKPPPDQADMHESVLGQVPGVCCTRTTSRRCSRTITFFRSVGAHPC